MPVPSESEMQPSNGHATPPPTQFFLGTRTIENPRPTLLPLHLLLKSSQAPIRKIHRGMSQYKGTSHAVVVFVTYLSFLAPHGCVDFVRIRAGVFFLIKREWFVMDHAGS